MFMLQTSQVSEIRIYWSFFCEEMYGEVLYR